MIEQSSLLKSVPGIVHGFSLRSGGCSSEPYGSLNLGYNTNDTSESVAKNLMRLAEYAGINEGFLEVDQVHGNRIVLLQDKISRKEKADGILSQKPAEAIAIRTADCAPILIAHYNPESHRKANMIAVVHAGWRGAVSGIVIKAIEAMCQYGAQEKHLIFALGPCIGPEKFEVGAEVIEAAKAQLDDHALPYEPKEAGKFNFDLREFIRLQLLEAGISDAAIEFVGACTYSNPELYFSYRRDQGETGHHLSYIMLEA